MKRPSTLVHPTLERNNFPNSQSSRSMGGMTHRTIKRDVLDAFNKDIASLQRLCMSPTPHPSVVGYLDKKGKSWSWQIRGRFSSLSHLLRPSSSFLPLFPSFPFPTTRRSPYLSIPRPTSRLRNHREERKVLYCMSITTRHDKDFFT